MNNSITVISLSARIQAEFHALVPPTMSVAAASLSGADADARQDTRAGAREQQGQAAADVLRSTPGSLVKSRLPALIAAAIVMETAP
ncbi:hypothetical protein [Accumulibacter sp.]|uniref:hypothetical protein n=1 Tax=Accumulibacter sp. TaxID=2053492 RepID=UPI00262958CB|nr:hypothetical protein [Accumulibacter sp.]